MTEKSVVVFYHKACIDGAMAAAVAYQQFGENAEYISIDHGDKNLLSRIKMILGEERKDAFFLDIAPKKEWLDELAPLAAHVSIIDHHNSIIQSYENQVLPANVTTHLNPGKSGSSLTFEHFHGLEAEIPKAVKWSEKLDFEQLEGKTDTQIAAWIDTLPKRTMAEIRDTYRQINQYGERAMATLGKRKLEELWESVSDALGSSMKVKVDIGRGQVEEVPIVPVNIRTMPRIFGRLFLEVYCQDGQMAMLAYQDPSHDSRCFVSLRSSGTPPVDQVADYQIGQANEKCPGFVATGGGNPTNAQIRLSPRQLRALFSPVETKAFEKNAQQSFADFLRRDLFEKSSPDRKALTAWNQLTGLELGRA